MRLGVAAALTALLVTGCTPSPARLAQEQSTPVAPAEAPKLSSDVLKGLKVAPKSPNSVGGVDVDVTFRNISQRTLKYVHISADPINAVGDVVESSIGNKTTAHLKVTGPVGAGKESRAVFNTVWYNQTIRRVQVNAIEVEFTDGTTGRVDISSAAEFYEPIVAPKSRDSEALIKKFRALDIYGEYNTVFDRHLIKIANRMCDHPDYDGHSFNDAVWVDVPNGVDDNVRPQLFVLVTQMYC